MPILVMGLIALAVFGVIGIMLFWAEAAERRQKKIVPESTKPHQTAALAGKHVG